MGCGGSKAASDAVNNNINSVDDIQTNTQSVVKEQIQDKNVPTMKETIEVVKDVVVKSDDDKIEEIVVAETTTEHTGDENKMNHSMVVEASSSGVGEPIDIPDESANEKTNHDDSTAEGAHDVEPTADPSSEQPVGVAEPEQANIEESQTADVITTEGDVCQDISEVTQVVVEASALPAEDDDKVVPEPVTEFSVEPKEDSNDQLAENGAQELPEESVEEATVEPEVADPTSVETMEATTQELPEESVEEATAEPEVAAPTSVETMENTTQKLPEESTVEPEVAAPTSVETVESTTQELPEDSTADPNSTEQKDSDEKGVITVPNTDSADQSPEEPAPSAGVTTKDSDDDSDAVDEDAEENEDTVSSLPQSGAAAEITRQSSGSNPPVASAQALAMAAARDKANAVPPEHTGFMTKQGHIIRNWKKRFFVVSEGVLSYYVDEDRKDLKGEMPLKNKDLTSDATRLLITMTPGAPADGSGAQKDLLMEATSPQDAAVWAEALSNHIKFANKKPLPARVLKARQGSFWG